MTGQGASNATMLCAGHRTTFTANQPQSVRLQWQAGHAIQTATQCRCCIERGRGPSALSNMHCALHVERAAGGVCRAWGVRTCGRRRPQPSRPVQQVQRMPLSPAALLLAVHSLRHCFQESCHLWLEGPVWRQGRRAALRTCPCHRASDSCTSSRVVRHRCQLLRDYESSNAMCMYCIQQLGEPCGCSAEAGGGALLLSASWKPNHKRGKGLMVTSPNRNNHERLTAANANAVCTATAAAAHVA
jgi:hypothetical protein